MTIRTSDSLATRVRRAAAAGNRSMNEYVVLVLEAATDPTLSSDELTSIRERLAGADLLAAATPLETRRPSTSALAAARRRAGNGALLSDIVSDAR